MSEQMNPVEIAQNTLEIEANALLTAKSRLGEDFAKAVEYVRNCKGKVVVTGLGKSGHIARKVSATLASTGTSAFFLHPSEALHGDMGMIQQIDVLLGFAYGGETFEVNEVCKYSKRLGIPIIGITGKKSSTFAQLCDVVLDGSVEQEACPLGLAPTASSTLALALGDCIAVSVMDSKGIQTEDFASWHPAGSLGKKLSIVKDLMLAKDELTLLHKDSNFYEILTAVTEKNYGIAPVVDTNHRLIGCITDGDLRRSLLKHKEDTLSRTAKDLMSERPVTLNEEDLTLKAINQMETKKITSIFVVEKDSYKLHGIIRMHDILTAKII